MDAMVKDDLVQGLLDSASSEGWTVLVTSHDIGELEMLADWAGFLARGRMQLSEPMESLKQRLHHVEIVSESPPNGAMSALSVVSMERAGQRTSALVDYAGIQSLEAFLRARVTGPASVNVREATLREIFVAFTRRAVRGDAEVAA
jgi:ABC-2 type transport system ATP-binding protein